MNKKTNIIVLLLVAIIANFVGMKTVNAEKWCYYKDENSMIRVKLADTIEKKDYKKENKKFYAYLDVIDDNLSAAKDGKLRNYTKDVSIETGTMGGAMSNIHILDTYAYNKYNKNSIPVDDCPYGVIYLEYFGFFVYHSDEYPRLSSEINNKKAWVGNFALNNTEVKEDEYWSIYKDLLKNYSGEEVKLKGCELIDDDIKKLIKDVFLYISILVPIGIIGISTYELAKAIAKSKEDEIKKAQKHLVIRIVVAILIFIVPTIVNIIFNITQELWENSDLYTCDITGKEMGRTTPEAACYSCGPIRNKVYLWGRNTTYITRSDCEKTDYTEEECQEKINNQ